MEKILEVEDEANMQIGLKDNLEFESYDVTVAKDGEESLSNLLENSYNLVLLDVIMSKKSEFDVCKEARSADVKTLIIFLTAKGEEIDKVLGLELGADDYITKPFSIRELVARIKVVLRRTEEIAEEEKNITYATIGILQVDFSKYEDEQEGKQGKMSHKEFEVLQYLLQHKSEIVSRYQLLENVEIMKTLQLPERWTSLSLNSDIKSKTTRMNRRTLSPSMVQVIS